MKHDWLSHLKSWLGDNVGGAHTSQLLMRRRNILIGLAAFTATGCGSGGSSYDYSPGDAQNYHYYGQNDYFRSTRGQIRSAH